MLHRIVILLGISLVCLNSGCTNSTTGKHQSIVVTSEPTGAKIRANNGDSLVTPGSFSLPCDKDYILIAEYPGYKSQRKQLKYLPLAQSQGSTLLSRIISGGVDQNPAASGTLTPNRVHFDFGAPAASPSPSVTDSPTMTLSAEQLACLDWSGNRVAGPRIAGKRVVGDSAVEFDVQFSGNRPGQQALNYVSSGSGGRGRLIGLDISGMDASQRPSLGTGKK